MKAVCKVFGSFCVVFLCWPSFVWTQWTNPSETCTVPSTGQVGNCIIIRDCTVLVNELQNSPRPLPLALVQKLQRSQCGFEGSQPKVCCPLETVRPVSTQTPPDITGHANLNQLRLDRCGPNDADRIINGNKTGVFEFPWMALIAYNTKKGPSFRCGGTLINERYVLTAAHCITNLSGNLKLAGVRLGEHDTSTDPDCEGAPDERVCAPPVQDFTIEEAIPHPSYDPVKLQNDIGLIRLSSPVDYSTDNVREVCLPVTNVLQRINFAGTNIIVTGWGATEKGTASPDLLKVDLPIVSNTDCARIYNKSVAISHRHMCAGGLAGKDSCGGDSGGPLQLQGIVNGGSRIIQHGVVSFGPKRCGTVGQPGVYTRVAFYMDWLLDQLRP